MHVIRSPRCSRRSARSGARTSRTPPARRPRCAVRPSSLRPNSWRSPSSGHRCNRARPAERTRAAGEPQHAGSGPPRPPSICSASPPWRRPGESLSKTGRGSARSGGGAPVRVVRVVRSSRGTGTVGHAARRRRGHVPRRSARAGAVRVVLLCWRGDPVDDGVNTRRRLGSDPEFVEELSAANAGQGCWAGGRPGGGGKAVTPSCSGRMGFGFPRRHGWCADRARRQRGGGTVAERTPVRLPGLLHGRRRHRPRARAQWSGFGTFTSLRLGQTSLVAAVTSSLNGHGHRVPLQGRRRARTVLALRRGACSMSARRISRTCGHSSATCTLGPASSSSHPRPPSLSRSVQGSGSPSSPPRARALARHRCRLLAEGIVEAHALGVRRPGPAAGGRRSPLRHPAASTWTRPTLERGSVDRYAL